MYKSALVRNCDRLFYETIVEVPKKNGVIDVKYIREYMGIIGEIVIERIEKDASERVEAYKNALFKGTR